MSVDSDLGYWGKTPEREKMVKRTQPKGNKAGESMRGFFEAGECLKNGMLTIPEKPKAVPITAKVKPIEIVPGLKGTKLEKKNKTPLHQKKFADGTLITSTMLPKTEKKSYWNTPAGIARRQEMKNIMKATGGKLVATSQLTKAQKKKLEGN